MRVYRGTARRRGLRDCKWRLRIRFWRGRGRRDLGLRAADTRHARCLPDRRGSGKLWITDTANNTIRDVPASSPYDIAGYAGDGQDLANAGNGGPAVNGQLSKSGGEIADSDGDLYVSDSQNNRIREIAAYTHTQWGIPMTGGKVYTIAGSATGVAGNSGNGGAGVGRICTKGSCPRGLELSPVRGTSDRTRLR